MTQKHNSNFSSGYRTKLGEVDINPPQRADGKKLFDWTFKMKGSDDVVPIVVHIIPSGAGVAFRATSTKLEEPIDHTDLNELHKLVEEALLEQINTISGIEWEDWFEVVVKGDNVGFDAGPYSGMGANLHVQVNSIKRGVHPVNGTAITVNRNGHAVPFPKPTSIKESDKNEGMNIRIYDSPEERSYIKDTPENRLALGMITDRMALLRANLAQLLSQEEVQERLAALETHLPLLESK